MKYPTTPPYSGLNTPEPQVSECSLAAAADTSMTPTSPPTVSLRPTPRTLKVQAFRDLTQDDIEADMQLKRRQQDLLVLTSLNDNSTLHWRPSWFRQDPFNKACWTLHNPPNVVTEKLPSCVPQSKDYYTRRIRQHSDPPALYIKTWDHWDRYCGLYGIPLDFLSEGQVNLMRLGLPRTEKGTLCAPPSYPLYPEPQPRDCGSYVLDPSTYITHLPPKFYSINHDVASPENVKVVVVHSDGALRMERKHHMHGTYYDGKGENVNGSVYAADGDPLKQQGPARRWTYVPWSSEQEESCKRPSLVVNLKVNLKRKYGTFAGNGTIGTASETEEKKKKQQTKADRMLRELQ